MSNASHEVAQGPHQTTGVALSALSAHHIVKRFPGVLANDDVNFDVRAGEVHTLLGENGAGKSTLAAILCGLYQPDSGHLERNGKPMHLPSPRAGLHHGIAMVHQQFALVRRASVLQNVMMGSAARLAPWRILLGAYPDAVVAEAMSALSAVGIEGHRARHRVLDLSGGQQQRAAIARAMMGSPAVILADEPVASLDPLLAEDMMILLTSLSSRLGASLVCSLHQHDLARRYFPRIVTLENGRVLSDERQTAGAGITRPPRDLRRLSRQS